MRGRWAVKGEDLLKLVGRYPKEDDKSPLEMQCETNYYSGEEEDLSWQPSKFSADIQVD